MAISSSISESSSPAKRAFQILHLGFVAAPVLAGADKFLGFLTDWEKYVPSTVAQIIDPHTLMLIVGAIEIIAGIVVAIKPRFGGYLVASWLGLIIVNLLMIPGYFDVALRDFGLLLGALALAQLAQQFHGAPSAR